MLSDEGPEVRTLLTRTTAATWKLYVAPRSREVTRAEVTLAPTDRVLAVCVCVGGVQDVYRRINKQDKLWVMQDNRWYSLLALTVIILGTQYV